jgi:ABC-type Fe3+/spermidine/putrescine transport system ATPase subunit
MRQRKSTLLNLLAGVVTPHDGSIRILGSDLRTLSGAGRDRFRADHIGYIFQMFNLIAYLSVIENVCLSCGFSELRRQRAIVGARSSPVHLLLFSVFRIGDATKNIRWDTYRDLAARHGIAWDDTAFARGLPSVFAFSARRRNISRTSGSRAAAGSSWHSVAALRRRERRCSAPASPPHSATNSVGTSPIHVFALILGEAALLTLLGIALGVAAVYVGLLAGRPWLEARLGLFIEVGWPSLYEYGLMTLTAVAGAVIGMIPAYRIYRYSLADGIVIRI